MKTPLLQTEYYVSQKYFEEIKDPGFKKESEMMIDREFLVELENKCEGKKREKKRIEEVAYRERPGPGR